MSFIIGFHRSGASLLTSVLQDICGYNRHLPFTLVPSAENSLEGSYESLELFTLNNQLLESVGHSWDSPWLAAPGFKDCMSNVDSHTVEQFLQTHPMHQDSKWVDNDPRLCLTVDMINRITNTSLPSIGIIRNPLSTSYSLIKSTGLSMDHAMGLWIIYNYHAFVANSSLPIAIITFEDLLNGGENVASQIEIYLKAHRSGFRDIEATASQDDLQAIVRHLRKYTKTNLVLGEEHSAQEHNNQLCDAAMEMWRALTCDTSGTYYPTAAITRTASQALALTLSKYNLIFPSTSYTCHTVLTNRWRSSLEERWKSSKRNEELSAKLESAARIHNLTISELEEKHTKAITKLEIMHATAISKLVDSKQQETDNLGEEIQLARSDQAYWHAQFNESTIVIRELQTEILETILKRQSLTQKLDWLRRSLATARVLLAGSTRKTRILQLRISQIVSIDP